MDQYTECVLPMMTLAESMTAVPTTGNIYREKFMDQGHVYYNYYIDCGRCGVEEVLELNHNICKTAARAMGYSWNGTTNKWYCPKCMAQMQSDHKRTVTPAAPSVG